MAVYPERRNGRLTGKWIAEVTQHGERRRKRFDSKRDGDRWADFIALTGAAPAPANPDVPKSMTFAEAAHQLKMSNPDRGKDDPSGRKRTEHVIEKLGDMPLSEITTPVMDELVRKLRKHKGKATGTMISPGTINRYLSAVSAVMHFAKLRGYVNFTPTIPWQDEDGKRLHWLSPEEEEQVVRYLVLANAETCAMLVRVLIVTGMRWSELHTLTPEQIEPENGCIRLWETKNGEARTVPINPDLAASLKLTVADGDLPNYYTMRSRLKAALKSAGLNTHLCIHTLRHTTATRLTQQGVPLQIVQKYLGHKNITTTTKYAHVHDDDLQNAMRKISPHAGQTVESPTMSPELT